MGLKDILATARSRAIAALGHPRGTTAQSTDTTGDPTGTRTGGRFADRLRKSADRARARRVENDPDRQDPDGPDGSVPAGTSPR